MEQIEEDLVDVVLVERNLHVARKLVRLAEEHFLGGQFAETLLEFLLVRALERALERACEVVACDRDGLRHSLADLLSEHETLAVVELLE